MLKNRQKTMLLEFRLSGTLLIFLIFPIIMIEHTKPFDLQGLGLNKFFFVVHIYSNDSFGC